MSTLLWVLMKERHLTVYDAFEPAYRRAAGELAERVGDARLNGMTVSERTWERWWGGQTKKPRPDQCRVLEYMFDHPVRELLGPAPQDTPQLASRAGLGTPRMPMHTRAEGADSYDLGRQVAMAASRAMRFAAMAEGTTVGPETLQQIQEEVARLAALYPRVPLLAVLDDLVEVQDLTFRLLESGRTKPIQARDLYLYAALSSGMLAKAAHDIGDSRSAMMQARAAYICADNADHHPARAWMRGLQSLIAYWAGQTRDAAHFASAGAAEARQVTGSTTVWLACLESRAYAYLGDAASADAAGARASEARERLVPDDLDNIGGLMAFPVPRQLYYLAEADVRSGTADAEQHAETAVAAYRTAPENDWAFGDEAGALTSARV